MGVIFPFPDMHLLKERNITVVIAPKGVHYIGHVSKISDVRFQESISKMLFQLMLKYFKAIE